MKIPPFFILVILALYALLTLIPVVASDYTLEIFGNANMDDTVDEKDVEYVQGIIDGTNEATELADANYDGVINDEDIAQIELIICDEESELVIVDAEGNAVNVKMPLNRIVVPYHDSADLLRALQTADRIVAVPERIKNEPSYYPKISELPSMGTVFEPDYEAVLSLNPDVFLVYSISWFDIEKLPGVACVHLDLLNPSTILQNIKTYGYLFDKREEADEFISWHQYWEEEIRSRTEALSEEVKPKVFHWWWKNGEVFTASGRKDDYVYDRTVASGGRSIAEGLPENAQIDIEWIIEQNPDVIVVETPKEVGGYGVDDSSGMAAIVDVVLNRPELANVDAVKNRRVYGIDNRYLMCTGTGYVISEGYFAKWFHPELFEDLDPRAIHQEYLTRFQGLDYDLDEHGVFVYPPLEV